MRPFHIFRYQILPNNRHFQGSIYDGKTVNDVLADKNHIFWQALIDGRPFSSRRAKTITRTIAKNEEFAVFLTGIERIIRRETEEFKTEKLDNWPNTIVVIWNHPEKQLIAIQHNPAAFSKPAALLRNLERNINRLLAPYQIAIYSNPVFSKHDFWSVVNKYTNEIEAVDFVFLTPNMASISRTLTEDLKEFAKSNNSVENRIGLRAHKNSSLSLTKNDAQTSGLVEYTSSGGGSTSLKIKGMRKRVYIGNTIKEIEIDNLDLNSDNEDSIISIFKNMFDD